MKRYKMSSMMMSMNKKLLLTQWVKMLKHFTRIWNQKALHKYFDESVACSYAMSNSQLV